MTLVLVGHLDLATVDHWRSLEAGSVGEEQLSRFILMMLDSEASTQALSPDLTNQT